VQHDSSSVLAVTANTLNSALCITLNLFKNLRLRIAIVCSAWRQPSISKHISTVSCDLVLKILAECGVYDIVNGLILIFVQRTNLQSVKQDWEAFRFYKLYNNLVRGNSTDSSKNTIEWPIECWYFVNKHLNTVYCSRCNCPWLGCVQFWYSSTFLSQSLLSRCWSIHRIGFINRW